MWCVRTASGVQLLGHKRERGGTNASFGYNLRGRHVSRDIVRGARSLGFEAEARENVTLDEVQQFTATGHPMIALAQVWRSEKDTAASVDDEWDTGHYIVVLGVDKDYVYFQYPFARMSKAFASRKAFEQHWH